MALLRLPTEVLIAIVGEVINQKSRAPSWLSLTSHTDWKDSVCFRVLIIPLAHVNQRLRAIVHWYVLHRRLANFVRLWPASESLWCKWPTWYRNCNSMAQLSFPCITQWQKVHFSASVSWTNIQGDTDALARFLRRMSSLQHLAISIILTAGNIPFEAPSNSMMWGSVLEQIHTMRLKSLRIHLTCSIAQRARNTWATSVDSLITYHQQPFREHIVRGNAFTCKIYDGTPAEVLQLFKLHLSQIYALFGETLVLGPEPANHSVQ